MTNDNFFSIHNLSISFGGLMAVDNVSFDVLPGSIFSIIGPNGAGKTTIFNCINGLYSPDSGKIIFHSENIIGLKPHKIAQKGIARTFQNIELFSRMTTMENLMLGRHIHIKTGIWSGSTFYRRGSRAAQEEIKHRERVEEIIDLLDLQVARNQFVGGLPYGTQKLIELGHDMKLIMDISDRILVINFGKPITEGTPAEVQKHPEVLKAYLGEDEVIGHAA
jgi:branched-chain amino acid transport system ATP-binding protein